MSNLKLTIGLVLVAAIAITGVLTPFQNRNFGAVDGETNYNTVGISGLKLGSACNDSFTSSAAACQKSTKLLHGLGDPILPSNQAATSWAATTTLQVDIAVTGVTSGDTVIAQYARPFPQNTNTNYYDKSPTTAPVFVSSAGGGGGVQTVGIHLLSAIASSTAGFVTLSVFNATGNSTTTAAAGGADMVNYLILR